MIWTFPYIFNTSSSHLLSALVQIHSSWKCYSWNISTWWSHSSTSLPTKSRAARSWSSPTIKPLKSSPWQEILPSPHNPCVLVAVSTLNLMMVMMNIAFKFPPHQISLPPSATQISSLPSSSLNYKERGRGPWLTRQPTRQAGGPLELRGDIWQELDKVLHPTCLQINLNWTSGKSQNQSFKLLSNQETLTRFVAVCMV